MTNLTHKERHQLYFQPQPGNAFIPFPNAALEQSIPGRLEAQVELYPNKLALKTRTEQFTYAELNRVANSLAHAIIEATGSHSEPVALMLEQGAWPVIAILATLKAGKFFVPLDPSYPQARISYLLKDSGARLVVTNSRHLLLSQAKDQPEPGPALLNIDDLDFDGPADNPNLPISPDDFAYIMYTSGSTGKPKGVLDSHRNVMHHMMRLTNSLHICPDDRQTLLRSYSFNGAIKDILGTLLNGATLYPLNIEAEGVSDLAQWLIREKITTYRSVISVYRSLVNTLTGQEQFPDLRLIHVGGEPINRRDVELFQQYFSENCIFINGLGITETGTISHFHFNKDSRLDESFVPVGYPIEAMHVEVRGEDGLPVAPGEVGEIVVKSQFLSPGYWQRPDLTAEKFLPATQGSDLRCYLTGDLGRLLPDGCLIHLGRRDFQVKVRGHRVEVAEVEAALFKTGQVKEVYLMTTENTFGFNDLIAYLVPAETSPLTSGDLRRLLAESLPDYMIPSAFNILDALPMTPTGKVDRQALPEPNTGRPQLATPYVTPSGMIETMLVEIWTEVLGIDPIGAHDNFFELGGHSLLAVQIISRLQEWLDLDFPMPVLFEQPTICQLAHIVEDILATEIEDLSDDQIEPDHSL